MTIYIAFAIALVVGFVLGGLVNKRVFNKSQENAVEAVRSELNAEIESKNKEVMVLKQALADKSYHLKSLEKDYRNLQQRLGD